jgi:hypothetical protein
MLDIYYQSHVVTTAAWAPDPRAQDVALMLHTWTQGPVLVTGQHYH